MLVWLIRDDCEVELLEYDVGPSESRMVINQKGTGPIIIDSDSGDLLVEIGG